MEKKKKREIKEQQSVYDGNDKQSIWEFTTMIFMRYVDVQTQYGTN